MAHTSTPTLLVFTLGPGREQALKRRLDGRFAELEARLHDGCLERALEAGRALGCRLRVCSPQGSSPAPDAASDRQAEEGFERRLLGAIRRAAADAGGPLIVVGSDTPGLGERTLRRTLDTLARDPHAVVVGPATDGGIYLLAANAPLTAELKGVQWRSRRTLASLLRALECAGRKVYLLPALSDLDDRRDLERWLAAGRAAADAWAALRGELRAALRQLAWSPRVGLRPAPEAACFRLPTGRAPPG